jgi:hypothetical protein
VSPARAVRCDLWRLLLDAQIRGAGRHAFEAELWEKALAYCRQKGAKAGERNACLEAAASLEQALVALGHLPITRDTAKQMFEDMRMAFWIEKLEPVSPLASEHISAARNEAVERQTG